MPLKREGKKEEEEKDSGIIIVTTVKATVTLDRLAQIVRQELVRKDSLARPASLTRKRSWSMQNPRPSTKIDKEEKNKRSRSISTSSSTSSSSRRREFSDNAMQWFRGSASRRRQRSFSLDDKRYYQEEENEDVMENGPRIRFHLSCNRKKILPPLPEVISIFQVLHDSDYFVHDDDEEDKDSRVFDLCYSFVGQHENDKKWGQRSIISSKKKSQQHV